MIKRYKFPTKGGYNIAMSDGRNQLDGFTMLPLVA
jgi:hypothetical protein